jgi:hypothetical protein
VKSKTLVASFLIVLGLLTFYYQVMINKTKREALDLGSPEVTAQTTRQIPIPPILGAIAILSGLALLYVGGSKLTPVTDGRDEHGWN